MTMTITMTMTNVSLNINAYSDSVKYHYNMVYARKLYLITSTNFCTEA